MENSDKTNDQLLKEVTDIALDAQLDTFFLFEPATGKAIRWNQSFRKISGYTDEEIATIPAPASYYSAEDLERAKEYEALLKTTFSFDRNMLIHAMRRGLC